MDARTRLIWALPILVVPLLMLGRLTSADPQIEQSSNIVYIGGSTAAGSFHPHRCTANKMCATRGGWLPAPGAVGELGQFNFAIVRPSDRGAVDRAGYDTAGLNMASCVMGCDNEKRSEHPQADLGAFAEAANELIIFDGECCPRHCSWLPLPVTTGNPDAVAAPSQDTASELFSPRVGNTDSLEWFQRSLVSGLDPIAFDLYNWMNEDPYGPTPEDIQWFDDQVFVRTGRRVLVLDDATAIAQNIPEIQVVNNIPYGDALFTVMLPPRWSPANKHPLLLIAMGYGIPNNALFENTNTRGAEIAAGSYDPDKGYGGVIVIYVNTGRESIGVNPKAINAVGNFLDLMADFGGDLDSVYGLGGSRGGSSVLTWAANPGGYPYSCKAVFAHVPLSGLSSTLEHAWATFPLMRAVVLDMWGLAWDGQQRYPDDVNAVIAELHTGSPDPAEAEAASAYGYAQYWDPAIRLFLAAAPADNAIPYPTVLNYVQRLRELGSPNVQLNVLHGTGHAANLMWTVEDILSAIFSEQCDEPDETTPPLRQHIELPLVSADGDVVAYQHFEITDPLLDLLRELHPHYGGIPQTTLEHSFSAIFPNEVIQGEPANVILTGEAGKRWALALRFAGHVDYFLGASGEFGAPSPDPLVENEGPNHVTLTVHTAGAPLGNYEYRFTYDGVEMPPRFTPTGEPAATEVLAIGSALSPDTGRCQTGVVEQFHLGLAQPNTPPEIISMSDSLSVVQGEVAVFNVETHDAEGHALIFDVLDEKGDVVSGIPVTRCGNTITIDTTALAPGLHLFSVRVKDGYGGLADRPLQITIESVAP